MRPAALAAAFLAGLLPGLLLYWNATRQTAVLVPTPAPTHSVGSAPVAPRPVEPATAATKKSDAPAARKGGGSDADALEAVAHLRAEQQETEARLAAAEKAAAEAQARLKELEPRLAALGDQQQNAQAQEKDLRAQLDAAQRQLSQLEAGVKARESRLADAEAAAQRAQRQGAEAGQRAQRAGELATEFEENMRRRESVLTALMGRYREATDLFRAMSLRLDNPRDVATPLNNDLARIQTAIQHAEEDLRQLRALNAQAAKLQKELSARR